MLNDLQDFMDRLSPPEDSDSSLEIAQLSKNSNLVIQAAESDSPTTDPQTTVSQLIDPLNPRDADCAEAMQLARAMTAKIQHHMVAYIRSIEFSRGSQAGLILAQDGSSRLRCR